MGLGRVGCVSPDYAAAAAASLKESGDEVVVLGRTTEGKGVTLK